MSDKKECVGIYVKQDGQVFFAMISKERENDTFLPKGKPAFAINGSFFYGESIDSGHHDATIYQKFNADRGIDLPDGVYKIKYNSTSTELTSRKNRDLKSCIDQSVRFKASFWRVGEKYDGFEENYIISVDGKNQIIHSYVDKKPLVLYEEAKTSRKFDPPPRAVRLGNKLRLPSTRNLIEAIVFLEIFGN